MKTAINQISSPIFLIPAYGRKYETKADVLKDWNAGKDFMIDYDGYSGPYCSIRDMTYIVKVERPSSVYISWNIGPAIKIY